MKHLFFSLVFSALAMALPQFALAQSAEEITSHVEGLLGPSNVRATYSFINHRADATVMAYEVQFLFRDADHSHTRFLKPEREKGREMLRLGGDIWSYAPNVARVVRIADRDSFAGGDFSNADVLRIDWLKQYAVKIVKDLPKQWIIELDAKTKEASYARMRLWVDKKSRQPVQQLFYDSKGTLLKRCLYGEAKTFGTITRPARLVMENVITKQKSELVVIEVEKVASFPDSRFVVDNLGK